MVTISCTGQSEARGRTGGSASPRRNSPSSTMATPRRRGSVSTCISHRRGRSAPVILLLTAADATALAQAIQATMQQLAAVLRGSNGTRAMAVDPTPRAVRYDV